MLFPRLCQMILEVPSNVVFRDARIIFPPATFMPNLTGFATQYASASAYKQPQTELFLLKHCLFPLSPSLPHCIYSILFHKNLPVTSTLGPTLRTYLFTTFYCATFFLNKVHFCEMWVTTIAYNHLNWQIPHLIYLTLPYIFSSKLFRMLQLNSLFSSTFYIPFNTFSLGKNLLVCIRKTYVMLSLSLAKCIFTSFVLSEFAQ